MTLDRFSLVTALSYVVSCGRQDCVRGLGYEEAGSVDES